MLSPAAVAVTVPAVALAWYDPINRIAEALTGRPIRHGLSQHLASHQRLYERHNCSRPRRRAFFLLSAIDALLLSATQTLVYTMSEGSSSVVCCPSFIAQPIAFWA